MVKYHPDARFLTDYAAGSLPSSQALCVATHLHYCAGCRLRVGELTELGAELFMQQRPATIAAGEFDRLLKRVAAQPAAGVKPGPAANDHSVTILPRALYKLTNGNTERLKWQRVGRKFRYSSLNVGDSTRETTLLDIKAGGKVPQHRHQGDEITVIIKGSFSDQEGKYGVGDFIVRTRGEIHQPVASQDQDCLCLTTLDAPIVMSNWFMRFGMKLLNRRHSRPGKAA
jgi:putative transcriptional regulator